MVWVREWWCRSDGVGEGVVVWVREDGVGEEWWCGEE